jgi:hypothetical protein
MPVTYNLLFRQTAIPSPGSGDLGPLVAGTLTGTVQGFFIKSQPI